MKSIIGSILIAVCTLFTFIPMAAAAKKPVPYISFLSVNQIPIHQYRKLTLYPEMLITGSLLVQGKLEKLSREAEVMISIDGRDNWESLEVDKNGAFIYRLHPEIDQDYYLYMGLKDKQGSVRALESPGYHFTVINIPLVSAAKQTLDSLIDAYLNKNNLQFMQLVHPDFIGDDILLHRNIRRDFSRADITSFRYSVDNWAYGDRGRLAVTIHFHRNAISLHSGSPFRTEGTAQLIFAPGKDHLELYDMKPWLFGLD